MELDPSDLLLFARVVEYGSFSRAAERVGLPKSTLSRRIALLETRLGERLLQRTTRKLALTEFGASLLDHAQKVVEEVEAATALVQHRQLEPSGLLRISLPGDFANFAMGKVFSTFMQRYPAITLELDLSPRRVDLLAENFDLAIRMGDMPDDATLVARRVAITTLALYASPGYTTLRGLPEHPDDLAQHDLLCLPRKGSPAPWVLTRGKVRWERPLRARLLANSPELLVRMAAAGAGIAISSDQFALSHLERGELVRILPEWHLPASAGWAVFPGRRLMPAKTRAFLDLMEAMIGVDAPR
ncbi:MAG: DNA-binding transcriptional LysR family regulator [Janthinobacterium sp.]|jgi:DNA-binding transcriptional LysR family regulator